MALTVGDDASIRTRRPPPPPPEVKPAAGAAAEPTEGARAGAVAGDDFEASRPKAPVSLEGGAAPSAVAGAEGAAAAAAPADKPATYPGGIDRRQFLAEIQKNPALVSKMAWMVRGEVGNGASQPAKMAMLETAFNRAQARGHSLSKALLSVGESKRGYYARQTYGGKPPTAAEVADFKKNILAPVLAGSDVTSQGGHGPMTGNASGGVARDQLKKGTPGFGMKIEGGQTEYLFNEDGKKVKDLPRLDATSAEDAATRAKAAIPNGVVPISQPSLSTSEPEGGTRTGGARRRGRAQRSAPPQPAHQPTGAHRRGRGRRADAETEQPQQVAQAQPQASPIAQQLRAMGLGDQQISQVLSQLGQDPAFQQFLNGRDATPELMQQYMQQNPEKTQALAAAVQQPLSAVG
jgi:hypothetical protein